MPRLSTIELAKENMKFSSGHFAIFSSEVRENLHGHNYNVCAAFTTIIEDEGMSFDYRFYKSKIRKICDSLNEITLIPGKSKYLKIEADGDYTNVYFNREKMIFLNRDIKILPVYNITVEELSNWLLTQILLDKEELAQNKIQEIKIKVFSGPGQSGSATWSE
jgi:6-pyruvoyltetrahydropterin/6-carboxytetrahydropterin synthase